jgi:hypothetical protein
MMIKQIILDNAFGKGMETIVKEVTSLYKQIAGAKIWEKTFADVAEYSEYITKEACIELSRHYTMLRFYFETFEEKYTVFPREDFIIALAMEFNDYKINMNASDIISLANAYIDSWKNKVIKNDAIFKLEDTSFNNTGDEIIRNDILEIISDKEKLIRTFFKRFEDKDGTHIIRIY